MAKKNFHEFRDPIHNFIQVDTHEREIIDSLPLQRLRHITQLATTYYLYPGATHKRFEHSLGVLDLATKIFDIITDDNNIKNQLVRETVPPQSDLVHWKKTLRVAALCHDIGHLPFSHAAEEELLPENNNHETLTRDIICSEDYLAPMIRRMHLDPIEVAHVALGQKHFPETQLEPWVSILSEIITGNFCGADRIDYLLRDSHHIGVAYGKFDHHRLINTLRILPFENDSDVLTIGIEDGGIQAAEALQLARYFMFTQVYFHEIRRAYDTHLKDFLKSWLDEGMFSVDLRKHLLMTDNDVNKAIFEISHEQGNKSYCYAQILAFRKHYKCIYKVKKDDNNKYPNPGERIYEKLVDEFGIENIKHDIGISKSSSPMFPVITDEKQIAQSASFSKILLDIPPLSFDYVFVNPHIYTTADQWLTNKIDSILN